jgi:glycosyltransferase A (GT-A) superfamily protein (DUF2064 family)
MPLPKKRLRPVLTVTVDADVKARIVALAGKIPAGTVSGVVRELLKTTLPLMEAAVQVMEDAMQADGSLDEAAAKKGMAAWIGTQLLTLYDTQAQLGIGKEDGT